MLTDFPVRFDAAEVRQTLTVLESIYREAEIVAVIQERRRCPSARSPSKRSPI